MSAQRSSATARRRNNYRSSARAPRRARASSGRSALRALLAGGALIALIVIVVARVQHDHTSGGLPLTDVAVIREQATDKHLDPALIAAVIYAETKFEPRTSAAGALGLMQIEPATAEYIAHLSGGIRFTTGDLATPKINVAYGSWYLRYLLGHYEGDEMLAIAAYNAGLANVDGWLAKAREQGGTLSVSEIPFPETKAYVERVLRAQREYRATYPRALGLT
ncbi:MAG: lytic transglycosylase domain-containing protein [Solirubrobacteraceae bacterium]